MIGSGDETDAVGTWKHTVYIGTTFAKDRVQQDGTVYLLAVSGRRPAI